jgi:hypothetical protein
LSLNREILVPEKEAGEHNCYHVRSAAKTARTEPPRKKRDRRTPHVRRENATLNERHARRLRRSAPRPGSRERDKGAWARHQ